MILDNIFSISVVAPKHCSSSSLCNDALREIVVLIGVQVDWHLSEAMCSGIVMAFYNTVQYNLIAKCQYTDCTRNVLWCQVHSSHIHSNHKTFNYNNSKYTSW